MIPKFRAWDKESKIIRNVVSVNFATKAVACEWKRNESERHSEMYDKYLFDEEYELLQSTGLKDKNGKEIYDGDILKVFVLRDMGAIAKVIFKNGMFGIEDDMHGYGYDKGLYSLDQILSLRDAEIIGNKFQNKDLLEEE
ncbi:hypothetical protein IR128_11445 [Staphylococcus lentus]|uniref:YopX family protein n=1 Tax=Mammaliicoccus lentus TaxID=42858 RepID=UPI0018838F73|nr:YopX family protein [Mammaliicoccus lentus]MBF0842324.1 hypothetical protein [Mammaliicoccus lentus]